MSINYNLSLLNKIIDQIEKNWDNEKFNTLHENEFYTNLNDEYSSFSQIDFNLLR